ISMTPNGQAAIQSRQPVQTSDWITTVSNSVRMIAPVGQTSRQGALTQCLQTSDIISQAVSVRSGLNCSMNLTWRQLFAESDPVLSYDSPVIGRTLPGLFSVGCCARSAGKSFH